jgi:hypothetical protein
MGTMGNPDWRLTNALGVLVSDDELGLTRFRSCDDKIKVELVVPYAVPAKLASPHTQLERNLRHDISRE